MVVILPVKQNKNPDLLAKGSNLPSYIPSKNFAAALMDNCRPGRYHQCYRRHHRRTGITLATVRKNVTEMQNPEIRRVLLYGIDTRPGDLNKAQAILRTGINAAWTGFRAGTNAHPVGGFYG